MTAGLTLGGYVVPAYRVAGHVRLTNKTPAATYRAPGRYEGTFVRERQMDAIAVETGLDPVEVRRRNLVRAEQMPYERPLDALEVDVILDSGDYAGLLDDALAALDWENLKSDLAARREAGETVGVGLAFFVEKSGLGPTDKVEISVDCDGNVELVTGAANLGQGVGTAMAQIVAGTLGVDMGCVSVVCGRTDRIDEGYGSHASRTTVMTGTAALNAATALRQKLSAVAAERLQASAEEIEISDGAARHLETGASIALGEIVAASGAASLSAEGRYDTAHMNYPYGLHCAVVALDRDTGLVSVERYLVAYDIGVAINPMLVGGQIQGGLAQGSAARYPRNFSTTRTASRCRRPSSTICCRAQRRFPPRKSYSARMRRARSTRSA